MLTPTLNSHSQLPHPLSLNFNSQLSLPHPLSFTLSFSPPLSTLLPQLMGAPALLDYGNAAFLADAHCGFKEAAAKMDVGLVTIDARQV
jgi:hypothetical protein